MKKIIKNKVAVSLLSLFVIFSMVQTPVRAATQYDFSKIMENQKIDFNDGESTNIFDALSAIEYDGKKVLSHLYNFWCADISLDYGQGAQEYYRIEEDGKTITALKPTNGANVSLRIKGTFTCGFFAVYGSVDDDFPVTIHATALSKFAVSVNNGKSDRIEYVKDDIVTITANTPEIGKRFKEWTAVSGQVAFADQTSATTTFTMPAEPVEVTAVYEDVPVLEPVSVNGGKSDKIEYVKGDIVTITANTPVTGKRFKEWVVNSSNVTLADSQKATTTFTMPAEPVEVTAVYEDIPEPKPGIPTITAGNSGNHEISSGKEMTFTCSGKLESLTGVYVDGKLLDASNYTLASGSTILTLKTKYLDTLSVGKHTLRFQYTQDLFADATFTITAKANEIIKDTSAEPSGTSNTAIYFACFLVLGSVSGVWFCRKKKQMH